MIYKAAVNNVMYYANTLEAYRSDKFTGSSPSPEKGGVITGQNGPWGLYSATPCRLSTSTGRRTSDGFNPGLVIVPAGRRGPRGGRHRAHTPPQRHRGRPRVANRSTLVNRVLGAARPPGRPSGRVPEGYRRARPRRLAGCAMSASRPAAPWSRWSWWSLLGFFAFRILPGRPRPLHWRTAARSAPEQMDILRQQYGLDQPLIGAVLALPDRTVPGQTRRFLHLQPVGLVADRWTGSARPCLLTGTAAALIRHPGPVAWAAGGVAAGQQLRQGTDRTGPGFLVGPHVLARPVGAAGLRRRAALVPDRRHGHGRQSEHRLRLRPGRRPAHGRCRC